MSFGRYFLPIAQKHFPEALAGVDVNAIYQAVNAVTPSLTRVEADEATYNLHIVIRFELERALMSDQLQAADLPDAWNEKYEHYLGVRPSTDADGMMQDVHWSAGLVGYFPTYALGNLYAAQLFEAAHSAIPDLHDQFSRGEFAALLGWLRTHVHQTGREFTASELIGRVSGRAMNAEPFLNYISQKLAPIYGW